MLPHYNSAELMSNVIILSVIFIVRLLYIKTIERYSFSIDLFVNILVCNPKDSHLRR